MYQKECFMWSYISNGQQRCWPRALTAIVIMKKIIRSIFWSKKIHKTLLSKWPNLILIDKIEFAGFFFNLDKDLFINELRILSFYPLHSQITTFFYYNSKFLPCPITLINGDFIYEHPRFDHSIILAWVPGIPVKLVRIGFSFYCLDVTPLV